MIFYKALRSRDDIERLYVSRKENERELTHIVDCLDTSIQGVEKYTKKTNKQKKTNNKKQNKNK